MLENLGTDCLDSLWWSAEAKGHGVKTCLFLLQIV